MMVRWEYRTLFLQADAVQEEEFLRQLKDWKNGIPQFTPEAMIPRLNALGEQGWELVHMEPVRVGNKGDVLVEDSASGSRVWTSNYFCVFKRPVGE